MFTYCYVLVERSYEEAQAALGRRLGDLDAWADEAYRVAERLRVGVGGKHSPVTKSIRLEAGRPVFGRKKMTVPFRWTATGTPALFPEMKGDLVLAALDDQVCQLALRGSYEPPLGAVGRMLDRSALHRVAEASVKRFVDEIAAALEATGDDVT